MPELTSLTKNVSNYVTIYPYREIEDEDWPAYLDEKGEWVDYGEGWREVGFRCPYPTVARLTQIRDLTQDLTVEDKSFKILGGDPKRTTKILVYRSSYELIAGKVSREEKKEEENFSEPSETTSSESMRASKSGLRAKKESTPQKLSDGESAS